MIRNMTKVLIRWAAFPVKICCGSALLLFQSGRLGRMNAITGNNRKWYQQNLKLLLKSLVVMPNLLVWRVGFLICTATALHSMSRALFHKIGFLKKTSSLNHFWRKPNCVEVFSEDLFEVFSKNLFYGRGLWGPIRKDFATSRLGVNLLLRAMSQNHYE